jgi:hypothetical protein
LGPSGGPFWNPQARKLRRVNERVDGYEPGGRRFESCRARHFPRSVEMAPAAAGSRGGSLACRERDRILPFDRRHPLPLASAASPSYARWRSRARGAPMRLRSVWSLPAVSGSRRYCQSPAFVRPGNHLRTPASPRRALAETRRALLAGGALGATPAFTTRCQLLRRVALMLDGRQCESWCSGARATYLWTASPCDRPVRPPSLICLPLSTTAIVNWMSTGAARSGCHSMVPVQLGFTS